MARRSFEEIMKGMDYDVKKMFDDVFADTKKSQKTTYKDIGPSDEEIEIKKHKKIIAKLRKEKKDMKKRIEELEKEIQKLKDDYNRFDILDIRDE